MRAVSSLSASGEKKRRRVDRGEMEKIYCYVIALIRFDNQIGYSQADILCLAIIMSPDMDMLVGVETLGGW